LIWTKEHRAFMLWLAAPDACFFHCPHGPAS
jgi:hypothetical protein